MIGGFITNQYQMVQEVFLNDFSGEEEEKERKIGDTYAP
jgi:hypothetical protein